MNELVEIDDVADIDLDIDMKEVEDSFEGMTDTEQETFHHMLFDMFELEAMAGLYGEMLGHTPWRYSVVVFRRWVDSGRCPNGCALNQLLYSHHFIAKSHTDQDIKRMFVLATVVILEQSSHAVRWFTEDEKKYLQRIATIGRDHRVSARKEMMNQRMIVLENK